jgi:2-isopropylmalate synthase
MNVRADLMAQWTNIETTMLARASKLVSSVTAFPVQYNKAIVGQNAFAHESGIHQDGMLKNNQTYEIMTPESVGISQSSLVMGKHSGRHAFREKINELGYELGDNQMQEAFVRFKDLADRKKHVFDDDIIALVDDEVAKGVDAVKLVSLRVISGSEGPQSADLVLEIHGEQHGVQSTGDGPVDATFNAIKALFEHDAVLQLYQVHAVTEGTDAQAEVSVRLEEGGKTVTGRGADTDTMVASARAYVSALNKLIIKRQKTAPDSDSAWSSVGRVSDAK